MRSSSQRLGVLLGVWRSGQMLSILLDIWRSSQMLSILLDVWPDAGYSAGYEEVQSDAR